MVVYESNGADNDIRYRTFDAAGAPGFTGYLRNDAAGGEIPNSPAVASASATSAMTAFVVDNADGSEDVSVRAYNPTTNTLLADQPHLNGFVGVGEDVGGIGLSTLTSGNYVLAIGNRNAGNDDVRVKIRNPDGTQAFNTDIATGGEILDVTVAGLTGPGGNLAVVWTNTLGNIFASVRDNTSGVVRAPFWVNSTTPSQNEPSVAALADGGFVVVWDDDTGGSPNIRGQRFDALGNFVGVEFALNAAGNPTNISVAGLADGRFQVTWEASGDIRSEILDTRDAASGPHYTPTPWFVGTAGADAMSNAAGDTNLAGGLGSDTANMGYGLGDDFQFEALAADDVTITGASGVDRFHDFESFNFNGTVLSGADLFVNRSLTGSKQADILSGLGGNDTLTGKKGGDTLNGGSGNDMLDGGKGNDIMRGGSGNDTLIGGKGADTMDGGAGNDSMIGGKGADTMAGGDGNDFLDGGKGNDIMNGGAGADVMDGGKSSDTFIYSAITDSGTAAGTRDVINRFEGNGKDKINVSAIDAISGGADDAFTFIDGAAFTAAGQIRTSFIGTTVLVEFETTGDNVADMAIEINLKKGAIDATDFFL